MNKFLAFLVGVMLPTLGFIVYSVGTPTTSEPAVGTALRTFNANQLDATYNDGDCLTTNGSGVLSWSASCGGGGGASSTIITFNDGAQENSGVPTLDWNTNFFTITESPADEFNITGINDSQISSSTLNIPNWQNKYILMASSSATGGMDWVATSTLNIGGSGATALAELSDVDTVTYTAGRMLIANGSQYDDQAISGDIAITSGGAVTIQNGAVDNTDLADTDFGDWTCSSGTCTLNNDVVAPAEMADADHGDFTYSSGNATLDANTVATNELDLSITPTWTGLHIFNGNASTTDFTASDDIYIGDRLIHDGDSDTYMQFTANQFSQYAGGVWHIFANSSDYTINPSGDAGHKFEVGGGTSANLILADHDLNSVGFGTSTPEAKVDIWGINSGKIITLFSNSGTKFMEMLNTGVTTLLGAWDFGGATSLEIPNAADPTVDAEGEIALDTTTSTVRFYEGSTEFVLSPFWSWGPNLASTSLAYDGGYGASGSTTVERAGMKYAMTITEIYCKTDTGSALIEVGDGSASSTALRCDSDGATDSSPSNVSFGVREDIKIQVGSQLSDPNHILIDFTSKWTE